MACGRIGGGVSPTPWDIAAAGTLDSFQLLLWLAANPWALILAVIITTIICAGKGI